MQAMFLLFFLSLFSVSFSFGVNFPHKKSITHNMGSLDNRRCSWRQMTIVDIADESPDDTAEAPATHGYEGDFMVGDIVKVVIHTKIYSVKQYSSEGFDPCGFVGTVDSLALYGRKLKTLCSAITPVKVAFFPDNKSLPSGMFDKKWIAHFAGAELELVERPPPVEGE